MKILYGSTNVTKYVTSYKKKGDFQSGLLLGQTPSYEIELKVKNKDGIFGDLSEFFTIFEGTEQTGIFSVYEKPEKYTKTITLILYDNMLKLNPRYMSELDYIGGNVTIKDQLNEISSLTGLSIDYSNFPDHVLNKKVVWYDNTLSMRNHIGWIAEIAGCNVSINSFGVVVFKEINPYFDFETERVGDYEIEEVWKVSRVCFNNGLVLYEKGNKTNNTLYISENNPYCDEQSLVDYIYNKYNGLTLMGVSKIKMRGIRNLRLGDVVKYNSIHFIVLSLTANEFGGESYPIYEINGKLPTKNEEIAENRIDTSVKIRRLQVLYDQNEAALNILTQDVEDNSEKIGELVISNEKISTEVSNNTKSIYKFESGSGNIFDNTYQFIAKDLTDLSEITINNMPLGIHKEELKGKDIVISVNADVKDGMFGELQGFVGAEFTVTFSDKTEETYKTRFYVGQTTFQYVLACNSLSIEKRIYTHYKLPDKDIQSVSNLKLICSVNGKSVYVANPKVEFGTYPTGYEFDISNIRDNIVTLDREFTLIEQKVDELSLQAVSMTQEITTIKGDVSTVTTRLESTELKLQPTNILLAVNEKIGSDGQLYTTKFILDKSGVHIKGGGLDISNNAGTKVLYADTSGNLVINNLNAVDGIFSGNIQGSTITGGTILGSSITGGTITGNTTISVGTNLTVGNNIYLGNCEDRDTKKYIYFNDQFWIGSRNNIITMGYENGHPFKGKVYVDTSGNIVSWANSLNFIEAGSNCLHLYEDRTTSTYSITVTSDARRKTNFKNPDTSWIYQLRVSGFEYLSCIGTEMIGLVAQDYVDYEWSKYFVRKNDDGYYSIDYQNVCMALLNEFIKLRNNFINANNEIAFLRSKIGGI